MLEALKLNRTFIFIPSKAHWLCWVNGVEGSTPVVAVTTSNATSSPLHARRATVKGVARHAIVVVAVDKVVARAVPAVCREETVHKIINKYHHTCRNIVFMTITAVIGGALAIHAIWAKVFGYTSYIF